MSAARSRGPQTATRAHRRSQGNPCGGSVGGGHSGIGKPAEAERRRLADRAARIITERDSTHGSPRRGFPGVNPRLDDQSPARVLRTGDLEADGAA